MQTKKIKNKKYFNEKKARIKDFNKSVWSSSLGYICATIEINKKKISKKKFKLFFETQKYEVGIASNRVKKEVAVNMC